MDSIVLPETSQDNYLQTSLEEYSSYISSVMDGFDPLKAGLEISENRHLPCITKFIGMHGENLIFSRNIKIFTCPAA